MHCMNIDIAIVKSFKHKLFHPTSIIHEYMISFTLMLFSVYAVHDFKNTWIDVNAHHIQ